MMSLAGSLANCVLADAILILPTHRYNEGKGSSKVQKLVPQKPLEMYGWLNASLKSTETRDELSTTCNPK